MQRQIPFNDIGKVIKKSISTEAVATAVNELSTGQKHHLLTDHFVPPAQYAFLLKQFGLGQRAFQSRYLRDYLWMMYSPATDGAICKHCAVMMAPINRITKVLFC